MFLMSSAFRKAAPSEEIRVVLDDRNTEGIMERLDWLLDGVQDKDEPLLFFSGHGAQIPGYNVKDEPDHADERLAPYDFDCCRRGRSATKYYSARCTDNFPMGAIFVAMFDSSLFRGPHARRGRVSAGLRRLMIGRPACCEWEKDEKMWCLWGFSEPDPSLADKKIGAEYFGQRDGDTTIWAGDDVRTRSNDEYDKTRKEAPPTTGHLPILLEALPIAGVFLTRRHALCFVRRVYILYGQGAAGTPRPRRQSFLSRAQ